MSKPYTTTGGAAARADGGIMRNVLVAVAGNALEWFDVVVYGFFAAIVARLFFPAHDPSVSIILALGTFGASFLIRPLGAVVIGRYADRAGRKAALVLVSTLMLIGTGMIAILPTYRQIGIAAPLLLFAARLLQGFSAGGEFGSATAFLAEQMPTRRAFYASWQFASQGIATLLASGFGLAITTTLSADQIESWAWRLPFVFGLLIGPIAYVIRKTAHETPEFTAELMAQAEAPVHLGNGRFATRVLVGVGTVVVATVAMFLMLYIPTMATAELKLPVFAGYAATLLTGVTLVIVTPLAGMLADRRGRFSIALPAVTVLLIAPFPLFHWLVAAPSPARIIAVQGLLGVATSMYFGALPAFLAELFPVARRTTGMSLSYNLAVVLAGGFAPVIFAFLIRATGSKAAPAAYLSFAAGCSLLAWLFARGKRWTW